MQNIWFTSDHHFGHNNVIKFCHRPFDNVDDMRESLIQRHNEVVKKGDLVYVLGDMFWRSEGKDKAVETLRRMNGQKYYVWGNHEEVVEAIYNDPRTRQEFIWYRDLTHIHPKPYPKIVLCHYAMRVWNGSHKGAWHLYGHSHAGLSKSVAGSSPEESPLSMDIGVDTHNYYPWSIDEIAQVIETKNAEWAKPQMRCPDCGHYFIGAENPSTPVICAKCNCVMEKVK